MAEKPTRTTATATNISLEGSKADRHVWLMKCPPIVYRVLQHQHSAPLPPPPSSSSTDTDSSALPVAKVIVAVNPLLPNDDFASTEFTMELPGTEPGNIPKCYSLDMSTDFIPMSIFSESVQGRLSVEGKIYHKFDMKPHNENIENYGKLCRERTNKYMTKSRQIQVIDNDNGKHMRPMPGIFASKPTTTTGSAEKKKAPTKGSELKRTRRDRDEMEEIMFKLFEKQPNWTLKQLIQETDQPEQFLKDMLKLLCVYNNKGTNQGTYELKPEYKRSEDS
ncbi:PREDICTED: general transcription factor IIF subunit 2-like isoform X2 [Ipomoea nil]|uniref:general transcription factor IIF subunit 2-like isoform X2 n=1 Tax=Ipomoea nil TaxID=35883 RepID=UPI000900880B|nr:PREDICTED: general transcription factor IIF subunit 2-like isoform X2 [Ipomoea nil]